MSRIIFLLIMIMLPTFGICSVIHYKNDIVPIVSNHIDQDSLLIQRIYELKEVQEKESYLGRISKGKGHLAIMITSKPSKNEPYYLIQVGYNNPFRFEVYFNFRIDSKYISRKNIIPYLDILDMNSNYIKLIEWRKIANQY